MRDSDAGRTLKAIKSRYLSRAGHPNRFRSGALTPLTSPG
jgi:hypothetical protein